MVMPWPFAGDLPLARARKIARAYRERLAEVDPELCASLDALCDDWGETWIAPRPLRYGLDDWLTPAEAADVSAVSVAAIRKARHDGRLAGRRTADGWRYQARDVLRLRR
jgi:hypothetical protein